MTLNDLAAQLSGSPLEWLNYDGHTYPVTGNQTWQSGHAEPIGNSLTGYVNSAYKANGIVFACVLARLLLFSDVRFQWQQLRSGNTGELFGNDGLGLLETPWPGGTTGDLLARMEQFASLAGNAFVYRNDKHRRLDVLRPDWVNTVVGSRNPNPNAPLDPHSLDAELIGYIYKPGGPGSSSDPVTLLAEDVAHYAPVPDPDALHRGMSWLTPVLTEIQADKQATTHKLKFFEHAATPNMVVKYDPQVTPEQVKQYMDLMAEDHAGTINAYKTLHIGGGADPKVVGVDLKQLDFKATQGAGETRIAAAAGVPPIVVGLSEGLQASTYSNYGQARRKFADGWARPAWRQAAGALARIIPAPEGARLWYDASDVSFLQEDERDAAEIIAKDAFTVRTLIDAGFTPDAVVAAVKAGDLARLTGQHSGLYSVQLQAPGSATPTP
ncbi:MAG: phage portal protein [Microthrixaceae bacterium]|nr:phage portal protein [Microthrixaceae bacterium]